MMWRAWTLACFALAGCDGGGGGDTTCALIASFSGAREVSGVGSVVCLTQFAPDIDVAYAPIEGPFVTIDLTFEGATKGETAEGLRATVDVSEEGDVSWRSEVCSVDITAHTFHADAELMREHYTASGIATCPPLEDESGSGPALVVERFEFVATPSWAAD